MGVNHPCIDPPHLPSLPYCNIIARPLRNIRPPTDPPFVYHTPYNIGDDYRVEANAPGAGRHVKHWLCGAIGLCSCTASCTQMHAGGAASCGIGGAQLTVTGHWQPPRRDGNTGTGVARVYAWASLRVTRYILYLLRGLCVRVDAIVSPPRPRPPACIAYPGAIVLHG